MLNNPGLKQQEQQTMSAEKGPPLSDRCYGKACAAVAVSHYITDRNLPCIYLSGWRDLLRPSGKNKKVVSACKRGRTNIIRKDNKLRIQMV